LLALTAAGRAAPAYRELAHDGDAVVAQVRRSGDPTRDLLARLAEAAVDLLTDPAVRSVRACEGPGCRLLFLPAHQRRSAATACGWRGTTSDTRARPGDGRTERVSPRPASRPLAHPYPAHAPVDAERAPE
jgi:predicted RNA-binding Zn ribbon-like protein